MLACAACVLLPASASAGARPDNAAATRTYLRIVAGRERLDVSDGQGVAALGSLVQQIATECPDALAYAPRDGAFVEIGEEVDYTLAVVFGDAVDPQAQALGEARALNALSWSDRRLTRLVRDLAAEDRAYAMSTPPSLCAQIAAWRESAYVELPSPSTRFLKEMNESEPDYYVGRHEEVRERVIARLLRPYERPAERRLAKRVLEMESRTARGIGALIAGAERRIAADLGVAAL
ncbi:MAG TPA: hypothetical protein VN618_04420 [Solirubrobacteraceae bacterium]|nr:hypothetical protein [Solirubrobacteraceae bacterium]